MVVPGPWTAPPGSQRQTVFAPRLRRPSRRALVLAARIGFSVAVLIAATWIRSTPSSGDPPTQATGSIGTLEVGGCFDLADPTLKDARVYRRTCTSAHQYELFWSGTMIDGPYPTETQFEAFYDINCVEAFKDYVGVIPNLTTIEIYWVVPSEAAWAVQDRTVQCAVFDPRDPRLQHSLKNARRADAG